MVKINTPNLTPASAPTAKAEPVTPKLLPSSDPLVTLARTASDFFVKKSKSSGVIGVKVGQFTEKNIEKDRMAAHTALSLARSYTREMAGTHAKVKIDPTVWPIENAAGELTNVSNVVQEHGLEKGDVDKQLKALTDSLGTPMTLFSARADKVETSGIAPPDTGSVRMYIFVNQSTGRFVQLYVSEGVVETDDQDDHDPGVPDPA